MAYIPKEHEQYPVLPYSREHDGEVFQYHNWPDQELQELVGEHLIPYGYDSYEEYFAKIDRLIRAHAEEAKTVKLLERIKVNIAKWNHKEDWSICKFIGEDIGEIFGLHNGGYYYWPCCAADPRFGGVIDDEEFTAYQYSTDPELWEIIVDPTGMACHTIYGGEDGISKEEYSYIMDRLRNMKSEDLHDVKTPGPVERLNAGD